MATSKRIIGAVFFVLLNNLAWHFASEKKQPMAAHAPHTAIKRTERPSPVQKNTPRQNTASATVAQVTPVPAPTPMELEANLPARESEELIADQAFSKETFSFDNQEQKIATIEHLTPQGEDLIFLQKVIESQDSDEVKIAALERLNGQHHYGALSTAIGVLNRENTNMSLAALGVIKNSRDASLIPQLRSRALTIKNEMLQQEINAAIDHLENSLTMGMDFANR